MSIRHEWTDFDQFFRERGSAPSRKVEVYDVAGRTFNTREEADHFAKPRRLPVLTKMIEAAR